MNLNDLLEKLKSQGIPILLLRDIVTQKPSITFTFFVVSGLLNILAIFNGYLNLKGINVDAASEFYLISAGIYLGRKFVAGSKSTGGES